MLNKRFLILITCIIILGIMLFVANVLSGYEEITFTEIFNPKSEIQQLILSYRLYKTSAVLLAGIALPVSGFLMQELFRNPLAGPSVLGISSSSALFIALIIFLGIPNYLVNYQWLSQWIIILSAFTGAIIVSFLLFFISKKSKGITTFIIIGFLISSFCNSIISTLQFYSQSENLKQYIIWSFGSFEGLTSTQILIFSICVIIGIFIAFSSVKMLIGYLLGEKYAQLLGVNVQRLKILTILSVSFLTGSATAMLGPITFIGIIIPYFCRQIWNPSALWIQLILNILSGIVFMLFIHLIIIKTLLPVNILSSIIGIPVILFMLLNNKLRSNE